MSTTTSTETSTTGIDLDSLRNIIDSAVKQALAPTQVKKRRGRKPKAMPVATSQPADDGAVEAAAPAANHSWFADAWHAFINDETPAVSAARDNDMRASFKSWLGKHKEFHKKKISDSYYNLLVSQKLRRVYVMKEAQAA